MLPKHPLLQLGARGVNATCRGHTRRRRRSLLAGGQSVVAVPRVSISYVLTPVRVPDEAGPDAADKFAARYGAANASINPDMAEAEIARQIAKLSELSESKNASVAESAKKALEVRFGGGGGAGGVHRRAPGRAHTHTQRSCVCVLLRVE